MQTTHIRFKKPTVNVGTTNDPRNQAARIILTKVPRGLFLDGDETDFSIITWQPDIPARLKFSTIPGNRDINNYPNTLEARGSGQLTLNPALENIGTGIYYCILVAENDPDMTSVEFRVIVQANSVPITRSPRGNININSGPPLFSWDAVEGVPYYFLFLSEGALSINRNEEGEITGLTGLNLTWQVLTPSTFIPFGDADPTGNFTNENVPPLIPGIEYNWIVLNAYGPRTDLISSKVAPVGPSFFEVTRSVLSDTPDLISPSQDAFLADDEILFEWKPVSGASRYRLFLYQRAEVSNNDIEFAAWSQITSDTQLRMKANKTLVKADYKWRVIAENANGISTPERRKFTYDGSAGWIKFIVNSVEGPLPLVSIDIRNEIDGSTLLPAITDTLGSFKLPLPTGRYSYVASRPGFLTTPRNSFTVPNNDTNFVSIQLSRSATTISGQVVDPAGTPVFDAQVELKSGNALETVKSEVSGHFSFAVPPGSWTLRVYKIEFETSETQTILLQHEEALDIGQVLIRPATNVVSGQATFLSDSRPLPGAFLRAQQEDIVFTTTTGSQGGYRFVLGPGTWKITLDSQGFFAVPAEYTFDLTQNQQLSATFQLSSGGLVHGNVSFQNIGVEDAIVQALEQPGGEVKQQASSDIHGNYALGLPAGNFELRVTTQNFLEQSRSVSISEGQTLAEDFFLTEAGFVQGSVINLETAGPVSGARIIVVSDSSIHTLSDASGKYVLGLPPGSVFEIDAAFPGFGSNGPFSVVTFAGETVFQDFLLKPLSADIHGRVTDGFFPIAGALVEFVEIGLEVLTDNDGRFEINIPPGDYTVRTSKECHFTKTENVNVTAGIAAELNIELQALKSVITGKVTDANGGAIQNALVTAANSTSDTVFTARTESSGNYELCLDSGIFRMTASKEGFLPANTTVIISVGDSLGGIDFILQDNFATLTGTVRENSGAPVVEALVTVSNQAQTLTDVTDSNGKFSITKIIPEIRSEIAASKTGFFGEKTDFFFLGQQNIDLNLILYPANGFIRGAVRDSSDNSGIPDALVSAQLSGEADLLFSATSDEFGDYTISNLPVIPNRSYQVFAFKDGFFSRGPVSNVAPNSDGVDFILVNKSGVISGIVQDIDSGEPLDNARVEATSRRGGRSLSFSDSSGAFVLTELVPTETYTITVVRSGFFTNQVQGVVTGDAAVVVELLRKYGFVAGTVRDFSSGQALPDIPVLAKPNGRNGREATATTGVNGIYLLRVIAGNYSVQPILTHKRSEPSLIQLDVAEVDTVQDVDFALESQTVLSIAIRRADLTQRPSISNKETHRYAASARDVRNRPVNIGDPLWSLNVSQDAAAIDADGLLLLNPDYFGDLTITATDSVSDVQGHLAVRVFAPIDPATNAILFDDRGLRLEIPRNSVLSRKNLFVSKEPLAPAKRGRAEIFTTDSSHVIKPAGLVFNKQVALILQAPRNTQDQKIFIAKWEIEKSEWQPLGTSLVGDNQYRAQITETGEYVAIANSKPLAIDNFTLTPNPFSPLQDIDGQMGLKIVFDLSSSTAPNPLLSVKIYNLEGNLVRLLHDQTPFVRGHSEIYWDGKADSGAFARNGRYLVRVILEDPQSSKDEMKSVVLIK